MNATLARPRLEPTAEHCCDCIAELPRPTHDYVTPRSTPNHLALGQTHYGRHYFLEGQPLYDGSQLEVRAAGHWQSGLFTWSGDVMEPPRLAVLATDRTPGTVIDLAPAMLCRWSHAAS